MAPGYVWQIRFIADSLDGRIAQTVLVGRFPSGAETGLKARPSSGSPVYVADQTTVEVTVDFDASESVRLNPDPSGKSPSLIVHPVTTFTVGESYLEEVGKAVQNELVVTFKDVAAFCDAQGACSIEPVTRTRIDELNATIGASVTDTFSGTQTYRMRLPDGMTPDQGIERYRASMLILDGSQGAGRNYFASPLAYPDDPGFQFQWHLDNIGQTGGTPGVDIRAVLAWDGSVGSYGVRVAVVDSCFDTGHPDLSFAPGWNVGDNTADVSCTGLGGAGALSLVHGTAVAGAIGATGNNGVGVTGVAWGVTLIPIRMMNTQLQAFTIWEMISGIRTAVAAGAHIINLSATVKLSVSKQSDIDYWKNQFDSASSGGASLIVAGAGNDSYNLGSSKYNVFYWPQQLRRDCLLVVGGSNELGYLANWSNVGSDYVQIAAPGQDIATTFPTFSTSYDYLSGTSMSAPIVSGVATLALASHPGLQYNALALKNRLLYTSDFDIYIPTNAVENSRLVNAAGAVFY